MTISEIRKLTNAVRDNYRKSHEYASITKTIEELIEHAAAKGEISTTFGIGRDCEIKLRDAYDHGNSELRRKYEIILSMINSDFTKNGFVVTGPNAYDNYTYSWAE